MLQTWITILLCACVVACCPWSLHFIRVIIYIKRCELAGLSVEGLLSIQLVVIDSLPREENRSFLVMRLKYFRLATTCFGFDCAVALTTPGIISTTRIRELQLWESIILNKGLLLIIELQFQSHSPL